MDPILWLTLLTRVAGGVLATQGQPELGGLLNDLATAARQGKNVDDLLKAIAEKWDADGPPSLDEIAEHRKSVQARMD